MERFYKLMWWAMWNIQKEQTIGKMNCGLQCLCAFFCFCCSVWLFPGVKLENFTICKELLIPPGTQNYMVRMRLYDVNKRQLNLTIRIVCRAEGSLKILISAPYWLINKTGEFYSVFFQKYDDGIWKWRFHAVFWFSFQTELLNSP